MSQVGYLELPFKQYISFQDSVNSNMRWSVATQSLDRVWLVHRDADYGTATGAKLVSGHKVAGGFTAAASGGTLNPFPVLVFIKFIYRLGIDGRTTWPVALKKDTVPPQYYWCMLILCVLGQFLAQKEVGSLYTFRHYGCSPGTRPCLD